MAIEIKQMVRKLRREETYHIGERVMNRVIGARGLIYSRTKNEIIVVSGPFLLLPNVEYISVGIYDPSLGIYDASQKFNSGGSAALCIACFPVLRDRDPEEYSEYISFVQQHGGMV